MPNLTAARLKESEKPLFSSSPESGMPGGSVGQADGQPTDDRMLQGDVLVPPVRGPEDVVKAVHDRPSRDVLKLPSLLGPNADLVVLEGRSESREEIEVLIHVDHDRRNDPSSNAPSVRPSLA
jgi:hypothetical protein